MGRIHDLARDMGVEFDQLALVVNRMRPGANPDASPALARELQKRTRADALLTLPDDPALAALDEAGDRLAGLPTDNPLIRRMDILLDNLGFAPAE